MCVQRVREVGPGRLRSVLQQVVVREHHRRRFRSEVHLGGVVREVDHERSELVGSLDRGQCDPVAHGVDLHVHHVAAHHEARGDAVAHDLGDVVIEGRERIG